MVLVDVGDYSAEGAVGQGQEKEEEAQDEYLFQGLLLV